MIKVSYNAPFTLTFTFACVAAFIAIAFTGGWAAIHIFSVSGDLGFANPRLYPRLFLHVLGHASTEHLAFNMMIILLLGPILEEKYGAGRLLLIAALTALSTGLVMVLLLPGYLLGASGVAFALILLSSYTKAKSGALPLTFVLVVFIFLGQEIYMFFADSRSESGIAHFAHIIGGLIGAGAGFAMRR